VDGKEEQMKSRRLGRGEGKGEWDEEERE